jgi:fumarate reductase subunit D
VFNLKPLFRSTAAKVAVVALAVPLLLEVLGIVHLLDWLLDLPENRHVALLFAFLVSPKGRLITDLAIAVAGWSLLHKRFAQHFRRPTLPLISIVSTAVIGSQFTDGAFTPEREAGRFMAVCALYNPKHARKLKKVWVQITFTLVPSGTEHLQVRNCYWLTQRTPAITFESGSFQHVVVAEWAMGQPIVVPRFIAGEPEKVPLTTVDPLDVRVTLFDDSGAQLSEFYCKMLPANNPQGAFDRVSLEVKRG